MSGGGAIIEKRAMTLTDSEAPGWSKEVIRYWLLDSSGHTHDETFVMAEPADDEPQVGEVIWWGGGRDIYWGPNDTKRLVKVGYSTAARPEEA